MDRGPRVDELSECPIWIVSIPHLDVGFLKSQKVTLDLLNLKKCDVPCYVDFLKSQKVTFWDFENLETGIS